MFKTSWQSTGKAQECLPAPQFCWLPGVRAAWQTGSVRHLWGWQLSCYREQRFEYSNQAEVNGLFKWKNFTKFCLLYISKQAVFHGFPEDLAITWSEPYLSLCLAKVLWGLSYKQCCNSLNNSSIHSRSCPFHLNCWNNFTPKPWELGTWPFLENVNHHILYPLILPIKCTECNVKNTISFQYNCFNTNFRENK